jgi:hydroxymethylpyrimidine/phosphomethylpyrimidine kinase
LDRLGELICQDDDGGAKAEELPTAGPTATLYDNDPVTLSQTNLAVVMVGGVDPGGGAGLLRDAATAAARGARAHAIGTAWTEQGDGRHRVEPRAPAAVGAALAEALAAAAAVKIGMAVGPATAAAIVEALGGYPGPVVVDPVLASSRGGPLWAGTPRELLPLARRATLVTPNAGEAAALAGGGPVSTVAEAEAAGRRLLEAEGLRAVLVKGGHLGGAGDETVTDVLVTAGGTRRLARARVAAPAPRGTGCALATAIAVELGRGAPLADAVELATAWLARAIAAAQTVGDERHL